jgi:serine/threonine protein phosphatase 1
MIQINVISSVPSVKYLSIDSDQRVLVVGDIHGDYTQLKDTLTRLNFDPSVDTLICLGDMIDRGPNNVAVLNHLLDVNAIMLLGNHEHLMLESVLNNDEEALAMWNKNGGRWHEQYGKKQLIAFSQRLLELPLSIQLTYHNHVIGLSHTISHDWNWQHYPQSKTDIVGDILWQRNVFKRRMIINNVGVDFSIHGHNPSASLDWQYLSHRHWLLRATKRSKPNGCHNEV